MGRRFHCRWLHEGAMRGSSTGSTWDEWSHRSAAYGWVKYERIVTGLVFIASDGLNHQQAPMDTPAAEILIPLIVFSTIFGVVYIAITARHRQRMAMIEKGVRPSEFRTTSDPHSSLKFGMVAVGVGMGLFLGKLVSDHMMVDERNNALPYLMMVALCAGLALIAHFFIAIKHKGR